MNQTNEMKTEMNITPVLQAIAASEARIRADLEVSEARIRADVEVSEALIRENFQTYLRDKSTQPFPHGGIAPTESTTPAETTPAETTPTESTTPAETTPTETKVPLSVLFIMDGSGSMTSMGIEPLNGLNSLVKKQQETGDFRFTLVVFSDESKTVIDDMDGKDIPRLTSEHYSPNGMTALLDAMGDAIKTQAKRKKENVLVVVLTDGDENASQRYSRAQIKELTTEMREKHKWAFMYLGANQDSFLVAKGLGITVSSNYHYSGLGCNRLFHAVSDEVARCVSGENPTSDFKPNLDIDMNETDEIEPVRGGGLTASMSCE